MYRLKRKKKSETKATHFRFNGPEQQEIAAIEWILTDP